MKIKEGRVSVKCCYFFAIAQPLHTEACKLREDATLQNAGFDPLQFCVNHTQTSRPKAVNLSTIWRKIRRQKPYNNGCAAMGNLSMGRHCSEGKMD